MRAELAAAHHAREAALPACRRAIQAAGRSIRALHRLEPDNAAALLVECEAAIREAQAAVADHPAVAHAGFLHDAEKEYVEAVLTAAFIDGGPVRTHLELGVQGPSWLKGATEAASELRRHLLDQLRAGEPERAEALLHTMEDVYEVVVSFDFPDAVTMGLRRTADALRAVLERTRSDLTTTVAQVRLQAAIEDRLPPR